jgi:hypothetical protein
MKYREPSLEMVHLPLANVDSSRGGMSIHALEGRQVVPVAVHDLDPAALAGDVEAVLRVVVLALAGAQHQIHDELQASRSLFDRPGRGNQDLPGEQHGDADHQLCGSYVACTLEHAGLLMAAVALTSAG